MWQIFFLASILSVSAFADETKQDVLTKEEQLRLKCVELATRIDHQSGITSSVGKQAMKFAEQCEKFVLRGYDDKKEGR